MNIKPITNYTDDRPLLFKSKLKNLYKKGKLSIKYGLYGEEITKKNVTDEHLLPRCLGGSSDLSNIALATKEANWRRGSEPIEKFLSLGMLRNYCKQFKGIKLREFDGDEYVKSIIKTIKGLVDNDSILQ